MGNRREFPKSVKRDAFHRANGACEKCASRLSIGNIEYDHRITDFMGGEPTLDNCVVLCKTCHKFKTHKKDRPAIRHTRKVLDGNWKTGKPKRKIPGRKFDGTPINPYRG